MSVVQLVDKVGFITVMKSIDGMMDNVSTGWLNDPDAFTAPSDAAEVWFKIVSYGNDGVDEKRLTWDGTNLTRTQVAWRDVTINVRCEAFSFEAEAADIVEMILFGLREDSTTAALNSINMAYQYSSPSRDLPTSYDAHTVSSAACDLVFTVVDSRSVIVDPATGDIIQTVNDASDTIPGTY